MSTTSSTPTMSTPTKRASNRSSASSTKAESPIIEADDPTSIISIDDHVTFEGVDGTFVKPMKVAEVAAVRPQMVYNYINSDLIASVRLDKDTGEPSETGGKLFVRLEDAEAWIAKYRENKVRRAEAKAARELAALAEATSEPTADDNTSETEALNDEG